LAEYVALSEEAVVQAPAYLTDEEASTLPVAALTAWFSLLEKGKLTSNQSVLVQGTGGVSLFGLQIGTAHGAQVFVTSSSDEKLERAKALGAHAGINYVRTPDWEKEALRLTENRGLDQIIEVSWRQESDAIDNGNQAKRTDCGNRFSSKPFIRTAHPSGDSQANCHPGLVTGPRRAFEEMNLDLEKLQLRPIIDAVYPFADAHAAYEHLYRGASGKIVIRVRG
jgi:NADPH:quinone reductase-like Zn-dependent oxidoreductase